MVQISQDGKFKTTIENTSNQSGVETDSKGIRKSPHDKQEAVLESMPDKLHSLRILHWKILSSTFPPHESHLSSLTCGPRWMQGVRSRFNIERSICCPGPRCDSQSSNQPAKRRHRSTLVTSFSHLCRSHHPASMHSQGVRCSSMIVTPSVDWSLALT